MISRPLEKHHKILFRKKIDFLFKDLQSNIGLEKFKRIDLVHATTLFSDGAIALKLKKEYQIPYIVAVRATDIDAFLKYRPDLLFLAREILRESSQIIFISHALKKRFLNHLLIKNDKSKLEQKSLVINNGINSYWVKNRSEEKVKGLAKKNIIPNKVLYVGSLVKRKNVIELIESIIELNKSGIPCELTVVGEGGGFQKEVELLSKSNQTLIKYVGGVYGKENLKEIYNSHHIFALPSKIETFGLVYIEALAQGLPILYVKNQGIDGTFKELVGEAIDLKTEDSIIQGLKTLIENYQNYEIDKIDFARFSWDKIAKTYLDLYKTILA